MGFTYDEAQALRRIEMTLQRWGELECGNSNDHCSYGIERDEKTNLPYRVTHPHTGKSYRTRIADREAGALNRLAKIMAAHPDYEAYHQCDPRGCALYIVAKADLGEAKIDQVYNRGLAICD